MSPSRRQLTSTTPEHCPDRPCMFHGRVPDAVTYVGRGAPGIEKSPYANPFSLKRYGLAKSRRLFREHVRTLDLTSLSGQDLACWCPPDAEWCHADDLLKAANQ